MNCLPGETDGTGDAVSGLLDFIASLNGARIMSGQDSFSSLDMLSLTMRMISGGHGEYDVTAGDDQILITGLCPKICFRRRDDGLIKLVVGSDSYLIDTSAKSRVIFGPEGTEAVFKENGKVFDHVENDNFIENLMLVDTGMPLILSELAAPCAPGVVWRIDELTEMLAGKDPLALNLGSYIYEFKIKMLLMDSISGMRADMKWFGETDGRWGFIHADHAGTIRFFTRRDLRDMADMVYHNAVLETEILREDRETGTVTKRLSIRIPDH